MAWMSDEQYEYVQDCKEKSITARSARHKKTHTGKGGAVKFPSDYMSKKEREAMNGECKSYRMNDPISWEEFKTWPKEHQETYIKLLRKKFNVPDKYIAEMMGISRPTLCKLIVDIGLGTGKGSSGRKKIDTWDADGFYAWCGGAKEGVVQHSETPIEEDELVAINDEPDINIPENDADRLLEETEEEHVNSDVIYELAKQEPNYQEQKDLKELVQAFANDCAAEPSEFLRPKHIIIEENENTQELKKPYMPHGGVFEIPTLTINNKTVVPYSGEMSFRGDADDILRSIAKLLSGKQVRLDVEWEVL